MSDTRPSLPPVRLHPEAELARAALATPLLARAVRLARWTGPEIRVDAGGELSDEHLPAAAEVLELTGDDAAAEASEAWRVAVDIGLVEVTEPEIGDGGVDGLLQGDATGHASTGEELELVTSGSPQDVLGLWLGALETVMLDASVPDLGELDELAAAVEDGDSIDLDELDWDPEAEAEFLDGVLANLYLLTLAEGGAGEGPVPLPALAASMIVPDDMGEPTDDVLEQVSDAMMRLDDQFRLLAPIGLVEYQPVDEALMAEADADTTEPVDDQDVSRYGMVKFTPLGLYGMVTRMREAGVDAPAVGDLAGEGADVLLDGMADYPQEAARAEFELWLEGRERAAAARELLAAARGLDEGAPLRRLRCQQVLSLTGPEAEPALREVLDDQQLGGLARVWLTENGARDVPAPPESMVFWLTVDTIAAQLAAEGNSEELQGLVEGLSQQHSGFFDTAWRVDHPATADVLDAMGRLHPDKKVAKEARKAAFKARSQQGV
ncbi:hypothetical protein [Streptomyces tsukubensis]|uniref:Uncharacterized protein n=1 Tax=Streptomyces tsukubensis TaxID=83656 RepID=A0A1V4A4L5_9ACTN|nr:hypothetical protein [Streptomyces tsukubensis]OON74742.1 hypothetical protein B1H18_24910 [Streptomyces tsukubensis]QFR92986.1 hypothetical protein GBW32_07765 [Streptomyces tsukubensis]